VVHIVTTLFEKCSSEVMTRAEEVCGTYLSVSFCRKCFHFDECSACHAQARV
jgi:hypothetical protein